MAASTHASSSADSSRGDLVLSSSACSRSSPQPGLLATRKQLERLVDQPLERAVDPSVEQVAGFDGRRAEVRDPLLEHGGLRRQLIQRQLGRSCLEPSRLRGVRGGVRGQSSHRLQQQRLTLVPRELPHATQQAREPFAPASADRQQVGVGVAAEQIAQRRADEPDREVAVGGIEVDPGRVDELESSVEQLVVETLAPLELAEDDQVEPILREPASCRREVADLGLSDQAGGERQELVERGEGNLTVSRPAVGDRSGRPLRIGKNRGLHLTSTIRGLRR